ncbi:MAG: hypothetical protein ACFFAS_09170 [Promethearchaeota archaeon]
MVLPLDTAALRGATNYLIYGVDHLSIPSNSQYFSIAYNACND